MNQKPYPVGAPGFNARRFPSPTNKVKIISLGGFGKVNQNMFVYEDDKDIIVVDCGVSFPPEGSEGDLQISDTSYLEARQDKIRAIILTHGHEDHVGGLPYFLPKIRRPLPIYASQLTAALAKERLEEFNLDARINIVDSNQRINLNTFSVEFIHVTHSIPGTCNVVVHTPAGIIFHASDFKFDWMPVMGRPSDVGKIATIGNQGVLCLLSDCLRSEKSGYTLSETVVEETFDREMKDCSGKIFITTMSSNVGRWQQAINVAVKYNRKVVLAGRSIEKIINIALRLGYLNLPQGVIIKPNKAKRFPPEKLVILVAGSQAQPTSSLARIVAETHREMKIHPGDKVIFSSDYIPGNELAIHQMIDTLSKLGAIVSYSDILDDLHVSGHAAQAEQALMIGLVRPKYLVPIGGAFRQMKQYSLLAERMGYKENQILLPDSDDVVELSGGSARIDGKVKIGNFIVKSRKGD